MPSKHFMGVRFSHGAQKIVGSTPTWDARG